MTETAPPPTLDTFYDTLTGEAVDPSMPAVGDYIYLPQQQLHDHPFMWALDVFVFAGPDAKDATTRYQQGQAVTQLEIDAYRIMSTTEGVMNLMRVL